MADFCKQCSIDTFGEDHGELANITTAEDWAEGKAVVTICEGCGPTQVDPEGNCIADDCLKRHGVPKRPPGPSMGVNWRASLGNYRAVEPVGGVSYRVEVVYTVHVRDPETIQMLDQHFNQGAATASQDPEGKQEQLDEFIGQVIGLAHA